MMSGPPGSMEKMLCVRAVSHIGLARLIAGRDKAIENNEHHQRKRINAFRLITFGARYSYFSARSRHDSNRRLPYLSVGRATCKKRFQKPLRRDARLNAKINK